MLSPRWRKVLRDLWSNKTRTALVVLSIAIGVFAIGMITGARVIMNRDLLGTDTRYADHGGRDLHGRDERARIAQPDA